MKAMEARRSGELEFFCCTIIVLHNIGKRAAKIHYATNHRQGQA